MRNDEHLLHVLLLVLSTPLRLVSVCAVCPMIHSVNNNWHNDDDVTITWPKATTQNSVYISRGLRHPISAEIQWRDEQDLRMQGESIAQSIILPSAYLHNVVPRPSAFCAITRSQITDFGLLTNNIIQIIVFFLAYTNNNYFKYLYSFNYSY